MEILPIASEKKKEKLTVTDVLDKAVVFSLGLNHSQSEEKELKASIRIFLQKVRNFMEKKEKEASCPFRCIFNCKKWFQEYLTSSFPSFMLLPMLVIVTYSISFWF